MCRRQQSRRPLRSEEGPQLVSAIPHRADRGLGVAGAEAAAVPAAAIEAGTAPAVVPLAGVQIQIARLGLDITHRASVSVEIIHERAIARQEAVAVPTTLVNRHF